MRLKSLHIFSFLIFGFLPEIIFGAATNPSAQSLNYTQDFSGLASTSTTYPAGWQGWQISAAGPLSTFRTTAPTGDLALTASGTAASTTGGIYNYNGKIGFLQASASDPAICLAINSTGLNGITIVYDVMTIRNPYDGVGNTRINEVTLQYRIGTAGNFISLTGIEYQNNTTSQTSAVTTPQNLLTKTITLPATCDNQAVVQLRWAARDVSGAGSRASFAFDNISVSSCNTNTSTYYYRSVTSGSWNTASTWEASPTGAGGWITACTPPTSIAASITIQNGHTVTVDANSTAPDLTVNSGGTLISNSTSFVSLTISGNLVNNGTLQMVSGSGGVNVIFNKNGNQSITGTGATTNFYSIGLNMGTSNANVLDISSDNFSSSTNLLVNSSGTYVLTNGTIKFSGSYTFSNKLFNVAGPTIASTAGIWLNNPNVTITGANYSYTVSGFLRITAGTFNVGSSTGNSILLLNNSKLTVEGGTLNVACRIQADNSGGTSQINVAYRQSAGTVNLTTVAANTSPSFSDFEFDLPSDSLIMSGGTITFKCVATAQPDIYNLATSVITGGTIQMGTAATPSTALHFEIESPSALPSLVIDNSSGLNPYVFLADNLPIIGNITINPGTTLDNKYDATFQYDISLTGNWNNSGTFIHNNVKTVTFNGSAAQTISGTTTTGFNNLTINNSSGGVTLASPVIINGTAGILTLTNGYLYTSATNTFTMNAGTSATGANNNSFVYGPMSKTGSTDFIFPVGKDAEYRPISATSLSGSETFTAEYFHADPNSVPYDVTLKDPTLNNIGRCEYWILNRAGAVNANVTLSWSDYSCGVTSLSNLSVARWDSGSGMWKDEGNTATTGAPDPATGTVKSGTVTSLSPFTLSSTLSGVNPLPIELLSFSAAYNNENAVDIKWSTASEKNNDYFTVERSADGMNFEKINIVHGAGNSTHTINYSSIDNSPLEGISYYRLKQTDFNGSYVYSKSVAVEINILNFEIISAGNSSAENALVINYACPANCIINFDLYDMTGNKVYFTSQNTSGANSKLLIPTGNLSHGVYLLKIYNGNKIISRKLAV
ncbi:MAG: T9SS type A sorting domain-containing protein [Bacteroidia bacterium]